MSKADLDARELQTKICPCGQIIHRKRTDVDMKWVSRTYHSRECTIKHERCVLKKRNS